MSLRLSSLALSAACAAGAISVGVFVGNGTDADSAAGYVSAMQQLQTQGVIGGYKALADADVANVKYGDFSTLIFPGGGGGAEAAAIGAAGAAAVRAFVSAGGGYIGTCAGGYLAGNQTCCYTTMNGYCNGATGCSASSYALGLIDMGVAEPWDRGHGNVTMEFTAEGVQTLGLDPAKYGPGINTTILYWQGPIQSRLYSPVRPWSALAHYTTEIHSLHPEWTTGEMTGTPSILTDSYGQGRVLISSPHPEQSSPVLLDMIQGYVQWTSKAI